MKLKRKKPSTTAAIIMALSSPPSQAGNSIKVHLGVGTSLNISVLHTADRESPTTAKVSGSRNNLTGIFLELDHLFYSLEFTHRRLEGL